MKNLSWCLLLFAVVSGVSCAKNKARIPDDILPMQQMAWVLVDVHLVEAFKDVSMPDDKSKYTTQQYYTYVFNRHHVTKYQFENSLDYYKSNPELMEEIYTEVINKLNELQAKPGNR